MFSINLFVPSIGPLGHGRGTFSFSISFCNLFCALGIYLFVAARRDVEGWMDSGTG